MPRFERLAAGHDEAAFIVSANLQRRNLTKGQATMALAMIYPEPKRGRHSQSGDMSGAVSADRLYRARAVLKYGPDDLVPRVIAGSEKPPPYGHALLVRLKTFPSQKTKRSQLRR